MSTPSEVQSHAYLRTIHLSILKWLAVTVPARNCRHWIAGDLSGAVSVAEAAPGVGWRPAAALQPAGGAAISALAWHPATAAVPTGAAPDATSAGWLAAAADDGSIAVFPHADG